MQVQALVKSNSARVARTINEMTRNRYNTKTSNRAHRIGENMAFGSVGARTSSGDLLMKG